MNKIKDNMKQDDKNKERIGCNYCKLNNCILYKHEIKYQTICIQNDVIDWFIEESLVNFCSKYCYEMYLNKQKLSEYNRNVEGTFLYEIVENK